MFFWSNIKNKKLKASLQTRHRHINPEIGDTILNPSIKKAKRTFSFSPYFIEGSMCMEAAISFSFFLIFFSNVLSLIFVYNSYMKKLEELQEKGKKTAIYSYGLKSLYEQQLIRLTDKVEVKNSFSVLSFQEEKISVNCVVKPWTGYQEGLSTIEDHQEEMVYMTEQGSVFHRDRGCTHLSLSIQLISGEDSRIKLKKYTACENCILEEEQGEHFNLAFYITNYGERYHRTINCKSLKRTVKCIPLSQVKGVPECTKCR